SVFSPPPFAARFAREPQPVAATIRSTTSAATTPCAVRDLSTELGLEFMSDLPVLGSPSSRGTPAAAPPAYNAGRGRRHPSARAAARRSARLAPSAPREPRLVHDRVGRAFGREPALHHKQAIHGEARGRRLDAHRSEPVGPVGARLAH